MPNNDFSFGGSDAFGGNLIDDIQGGVIICQIDPAKNISKTIYMSEGWTQLTGYTLEDLETQFGGSPTAVILPEDQEMSLNDYQRCISKGRSYSSQYRIRHRDGHIIWCIDRGVATDLGEGRFQNLSIITDVTPLMENAEKLRMSEARFRIAARAANATVFEFDAVNNTYVSIENAELVFNESAETVMNQLELDKERWGSLSFEDAVHNWYHPDDMEKLVEIRNELSHNTTGECEVRVRQPNGSYLWCQLHIAGILDENGQLVRIIGRLANVDRQHRKTELLLKEARSDALTGLFNKTAIQERISRQLADSPEIPNALLIMDVDNFKGVNDSLGHLFGDAVLIDMSAKLKSILRRNDVVGRIGGDEFMAFLPGCASAHAAAKRAEEICNAFRHTYGGEKSDYRISCSVGLAMSEKDDKFETLFHKADIALYEAKSKGKDCYAIYTRGLPGNLDAAVLLHNTDEEDSGRLEIKERIFELLYGSVDFSGSINIVLALLGRALNVRHIYIYENSHDCKFSARQYEWNDKDTYLKRDNLDMVNSFEADYIRFFNERGVFCCEDTSVLPREFRELADKAGVKSFFQVALMEDGKYCGIMGYDNMADSLDMRPEQVELMVFAAKVIGTFIIKKRADENIRLYNANKMEALDALPSGIYVIDEDYRLHYVNDFTRSIFPEVRAGMKCHEIFMKSPEPCADCPGKNCKTGHCCGKIHNPNTDMNMITSASTVHWSGRPNMRLISCQILDGE